MSEGDPGEVPGKLVKQMNQRSVRNRTKEYLRKNAL